jgi:hypothetical protein
LKAPAIGAFLIIAINKIKVISSNYSTQHTIFFFITITISSIYFPINRLQFYTHNAAIGGRVKIQNPEPISEANQIQLKSNILSICKDKQQN